MTPPGIIEMAINNVEDFARDKGIEQITKSVVMDQMQSVGMDPSMLNQYFMKGKTCLITGTAVPVIKQVLPFMKY